MSAILCGKRSNFFEDLQSSPSSSPPVPKRIRCSPSSFSPPRSSASTSNHLPAAAANYFSTPSAIDHLQSVFPDMDKQVRSLVQVQDGPVAAGKRIKEMSNDFMHAPLGSGNLAQLVELRSCKWIVAIMCWMSNCQTWCTHVLGILDSPLTVVGVGCSPRVPSSEISRGRASSSRRFLADAISESCQFLLLILILGFKLQSLLYSKRISIHSDPEMFLERALDECGDLDSAIKRLNELRLGSAENLGPLTGRSDATLETGTQILTQGNGGPTSAADSSAAKEPHMMEGTEWVELFVKEMMSASNIDDAKARASQALQVLEKSISAGATKENIMLKRQVEALLQENAILKRAFAIQRERQKEFEDRGHEVNNLKQMVAQYQEQLRTLEVNNYALTMHLKQAQQGSSIPGRFHPDIF
ncbi:hypothetical protein HAX54_022112 [Datura stramonium]|uniref:CUE domain-containing protein n=1 Tax=Datura stramonium TaxID=4076 RepID=A0ABS8UVU4_DATST|nr:hypothetical protein [Datura stramonium]